MQSEAGHLLDTDPDPPSPAHSSSDQTDRQRLLSEMAATPVSEDEAAVTVEQLKGTPAMGKISQINGIVNRFSMHDLQRNLRTFRIEDQVKLCIQREGGRLCFCRSG